MVSDYFSMENRGGVIAANIEHQDAVSAILSLELLNRIGIFEDLSNPPPEWVISLETLDDILIDIPNMAKYYVQVKNQHVSPDILRVLAARFAKILEETPDDQLPFVRFVIFAMAGVSSRLTALPPELVELKNSRLFLSQELFKKALREMESKYGIPQNVAERMQFDVRRLLKDDTTTFSVFAHAVRRLNTIQDVGDFTIELIFRELVDNIIAPRRRERGSFSKKAVVALLGRLRFRNPYEDQAVPVRRTESGYSRRRAPIRDTDMATGNSGARKLMSIWRKAFFRKAIMNFLLGRHGPCPDCGHPLMGGLSGLKGIQCPDCGFFPCMTLVAFCSCGGHIIVKRQPPTSLFNLEECVSKYILEGDRRCAGCGQEIPATVFARRCVFMPIPWPPDEYLELGLDGYMSRYHTKGTEGSPIDTNT